MQQRGVAIIKARKASSAFFAAIAACDHIRDWVFGTPKVDSLSPQMAFNHADLNYLPLRFYFLFFLITIFCNSSFGFVNQGTWVSMGEYSDGSYGIPPGLITLFLLNVRKGNGQLCRVSFVASICCQCNIFFP